MSCREKQLADALEALRQRLDDAAATAGRQRGDVELLPVTKFFPATDVAILSRLGCRAFGESREQEAAAKIREVAALVDEPPATALHWHMVGRIQRNKARPVARWADAAHSVDSERLAAALDRAAITALAAGERAEPLRVYVQISLDGDESRGGVDIGRPDDVDRICAQVDAAEGLTLVGLMGVPPLGSDAESFYRRLQTEHQRVRDTHPQATGLSAGMSADLEAAVKHGSTCVRVGTALLGPRPLTSP